jgi:hypothetical protein
MVNQICGFFLEASDSTSIKGKEVAERFTVEPSIQENSKASLKMRRFIAVLLVLAATATIHAIDLRCTLGFLGEYQRPASGCRSVEWKIESPNQVVTTINGIQLSNFNPDVNRRLVIENQIVNFIPHGLGQFFPENSVIQIDNSKLKEVRREDMEQFPDLEIFSSNFNDVQFLPTDLFHGSPKIRSISFNSNKITSVGRNFLTGIPLLHGWVSFWNNPCIDDQEALDLPRIIYALREKCPEA